MSKLFIYKEQNTDDRDCVKYIDIDKNIFECDHYFTSIGLTSACFSSGLEIKEIDFDNISSVLTKEEFREIDDFNKAIDKLGMNIKKGSKRYLKGLNLHKSIKSIIDKLRSKENDKLFGEIVEEEIEFLTNTYNLGDNDIVNIFENYSLDYRDRAIVGHVYDDIDDCAREEAYSMGYAKEENDRYFNYETFGDDLLDNGNYLELEDNRVVYFMY